LKGRNAKNALININNYDKIQLDPSEVAEIQTELKLKKQNILRCFELVVLAKLDPKDG
jgi:hypothetical protein